MTVEQYWTRFNEIDVEHQARLDILRINRKMCGEQWVTEWRASFTTRDTQEKELDEQFYI